MLQTPTATMFLGVAASPAHGTVTINDNGTQANLSDDYLVYTPNAGYTGNDSFTYAVTDIYGASATATVTITQGPVAVNDSAQTNQAHAVRINVLANDLAPAGYSLSVTNLTQPAHGTAVINADNTITYTPASSFTGADSFTYQASDGAAASPAATVSITVAANKVPAAANDGYTMVAGHTLSVAAATGVLANDSDADGDPLTAVLISGTSNGTLTLNGDGSFHYVPNAGFSGSDSFTYQASDGLVASSTATATITVNANQLPAAANDGYSVVHDRTLTVAAGSGVLANDRDPDGDPLTAQLVAAPAHGSLTLNADGSFSYAPAAGYVGTDSFTYQANDGVGTSGTATVSLSVTNQAPVAGNDSYTLAAGSAFTVATPQGVLANDTESDGDALTAQLVAGPAHGSLAFNADGSFTYTPTGTFTGTDGFTYQAGDGVSFSNTATVTLNVELSSQASSSQGSLVLFSDGSLNYTPAAGFTGQQVMRFQASNGSVTSNLASITFDVLPANTQGAVAENDSYSVVAGQTLTVPAAGGALSNDIDAAGKSLSAVLGSGASHGSLTFNADGSFSYTPTAGFTGTDSFTYQANDGVSTSAAATVSLNVIAGGSGAVANDHRYAVMGGSARSFAPGAGVMSSGSFPGGSSGFGAKVVMQCSHLAILQMFNPAQVTLGSSTGSISLALFDYEGLLSDYTATINWGDGSTDSTSSKTPDSNISVSAGGNGTGLVSGTHTYAYVGAYTITVTISGNNLTTSGQAGIIIVGDTLSGTSQSITINQEGQYFSGVVATFTDPDTTAWAGQYTAFIEWGEGHVSGGSVSGSKGNFSVYGAMAYMEEGTYTITVTIAKSNGSKLQVTSTATVGEAPIQYLNVYPIYAQQGVSFYQAIGTFMAGPQDPSSQFTVSIDWGDGNASSGKVVGNDMGTPYWGYWGNGQFVIYGGHTYGSTGTFKVTVTVTEIDEGSGGETATGTGWAYVGSPLNSLPPDPNLTVSPPNITSVEGQLVTLKVPFTDTDSDPLFDYWVYVNWGDGNYGWWWGGWWWGWWGWGWGNAQVSGGGGSYTATASHVYALDGTYPITVTVYDSDDVSNYWTIHTGWWKSGSSTATVTEAPIYNVTLTAQGVPLNTPEATPLVNTPVGNITYGNPNAVPSDFEATIYWGDGATSTGTISGGGGSFQVLGTHTYLEPGDYETIVSIGHLGTLNGQPIVNQSLNAYSSAIVTADPLTANGLSSDLTAHPGVGLGDPVLATFTDPDIIDTANEYTATVYWGDSNTSTGGTVSGGNGSFSVSADHTYKYVGPYAILVLIQSEGSAWASVVDNVDVTPPSGPAPSFNAQRLETTEGTALQNVVVATFSDPLPADMLCCFGATIDWGDGNTTYGATVVAGATSGAYEVLGTHTYVNAGAFPLKVTITREYGWGVAVYATAVALDQTLTATGQNLTTSASTWNPWSWNGYWWNYWGWGWSGQGNTGIQQAVIATFVDANPLATASQFQVTIAWGDGSSTTGTVIKGNSTFYILGSHVYSQTGLYTIQVTIADTLECITVLTPVTVTQAEAGVPAKFTTAQFQNTNPYEWLSSDTISWGDGKPNTVDVRGWGYWGYWWYWYGSPWYWAWWGASPNGATSAPIWTISGMHVYDAAGTYDITTTANWSGGDVSTAGQVVQVADAADYFTATLPLVNDVAGQPTGDLTLATFTSDNAKAKATQFGAQILWGDGQTSPGTVVANGDGTFGVQYKTGHTYKTAGTYTIVVTVTNGSAITILTDMNAHTLPAVVPGSLVCTTFGAIRGVSTGTITLATLADPAGISDFTSVTIDWGDSGLLDKSAVLVADPSGNGNIYVEASHTYSPYARLGIHHIFVTVNSLGGGRYLYCDEVDLLSWFAKGLLRSDDNGQGYWHSLGEAQFSPNTGGVQLSQPLDFDLSPGTDVGGNPALVYNSNTVDVRPIEEVTLVTNPFDPVPASVSASLDGGTLTSTSWTTFTPNSASKPGDAYLLGVQATPALTTSKQYYGGVEMQILVPGLPTTDTPVVYAAVFSYNTPAAEVVQDKSAFGAGWGIQGLSRLVADCGGMLFIAGNGVGRYFTFSGGIYGRPAGDFGNLNENVDGTFTYTDLQEWKWNYTITQTAPGGNTGLPAIFLLTSVVDPHGLTRTYKYDNNDHLVEVDTIDGGVTTLGYGGSGVTISEPGGRSVSLTFGAANTLTGISAADGTSRALTYDAHGYVTLDQWAPYTTAFTYNGTSGVLAVWTWATCPATSGRSRRLSPRGWPPAR
jgi:YD repeat-containing protein/VCBS repeat-containing protein